MTLKMLPSPRPKTKLREVSDAEGSVQSQRERRTDWLSSSGSQTVLPEVLGTQRCLEGEDGADRGH